MNRKERFTLRRRGNYGGTGGLNRGDRRKVIFLADDDRKRFLATLGEACGKTGWQVHAYCLMVYHFHRRHLANVID